MAGKNAIDFKNARQFSALTDKLPRFEIDDSGAKLNWNFNKVNNKTVKLSEILNYPEFFKQYPNFKNLDVKVEINPNASNIQSSARGTFDGKSITLKSGDSLKDIKSTLLHEIQHAIQEVEGFARGGNVSPQTKIDVGQSMTKYQEILNLIDEAISKNKKSIMVQDPDTGATVLVKDLNRYANSLMDRFEKLKLSSFDQYQRQSGELEARAVQRRMDLPADQRGKIDPYAEEAIATTGKARPDEFITRFDGGSSANQSNMGGVDPSVLALYTKTQLNQIQQTIHKMIQVGKQQQTNFAKTIKSLADTLQLKHGVGPIKEESSVFRKSLTDEGGKTENIKDINRGVIFVQDFDIAHQDIIMQAQKILGQDVERVKQDINGPLFRKTIINIKGSLGQTTEIQFTTEAMWKAKLELGGDELYHQYRITPETNISDRKKLFEKMERLYQAAYRNKLDKYTQ